MANWNGEVEKCDECSAAAGPVGLTIADDGKAYCEHRLPPRAASSIDGDALTIRYCSGATVTIAPFSALVENVELGLFFSASGLYSGEAQAEDIAARLTPDVVNRVIQAGINAREALARLLSRDIRVAVAKTVFSAVNDLLGDGGDASLPDTDGISLPNTKARQLASKSIRGVVSEINKLTRVRGRPGTTEGPREDSLSKDQKMRIAHEYDQRLERRRAEEQKKKRRLTREQNRERRLVREQHRRGGVAHPRSTPHRVKVAEQIRSEMLVELRSRGVTVWGDSWMRAVIRDGREEARAIGKTSKN